MVPHKEKGSPEWLSEQVVLCMTRGGHPHPAEGSPGPTQQAFEPFLLEDQGACQAPSQQALAALPDAPALYSWSSQPNKLAWAGPD